MERKAFATEFKVDPAKRIIEGYASTFGNRDLVNDVVVKGAYRNTLARVGKIKALRDHKHPIGKLIHAEEDSTGLFVRKQISDTPMGLETVTLVEDGVLDAMSIGYEVTKGGAEYGAHEGHKVRFLKDIKLREVSVVAFPANEAALITGVKSMADLDALMHEIKAGAYDPETIARLLRQAADKLLTLEPGTEDTPAADAGKSIEADPDTTDLLAVQSLIRSMTQYRRAA